MNASTVAALYTFATHFHSGQGSRGYKILCMADRTWKRHSSIEPRLDYWESLIERETESEVARKYNILVLNHADKV